jgi:four helix bundle protein
MFPHFEYRMMNDEIMVEKKHDLEERLIDFSVFIIHTVEKLSPTRAGNHPGSQLLRSGTSPALNCGEAQSAESKKDFIHKLGVVLKELRGSLVCLKILKRVRYLKDETGLSECSELVAIFNKSTITARRNGKD